jgi:hypothetical protein
VQKEGEGRREEGTEGRRVKKQRRKESAVGQKKGEGGERREGKEGRLLLAG